MLIRLCIRDKQNLTKWKTSIEVYSHRLPVLTSLMQQLANITHMFIRMQSFVTRPIIEIMHFPNTGTLQLFYTDFLVILKTNEVK